ncbi:MAG: disulfide bond formation protein B [Rubrivivax sp.]|nr:disulfide bond formation protein B [Rubrivivax sp.]
MNEWLTVRRLFAAAAVLPIAAVCAALVTQHVFGMLPCPWCVLQRAIFVGISLAALMGALGGRLLQRLAALVMLALAACGISAALWQHFVAAASASCNRTLADRILGGLGIDAMWPEVFAPYTSCADAAAKLLGVPYEFYSLTLFVVLGATAVHLLRRA